MYWNSNYLQLKLWFSGCLSFKTEIKSPDSDNEMFQELGINFMKGAQKDGDFLEKTLHRGLEKVENIKKYSEGSHLSHLLQDNELVMNKIGSQKQVITESIVPPVSQSNETQDGSLL